MKKTFFTTILSVFILSSFAQAPAFDWVLDCGNPPNTTDSKTTITRGGQGGFYMAGEFVDTAQFGVKSLISSGGADVFLAKLDASGTILRAQKIGGADDDYVQNICSDAQDHVYVGGYFYGITQIGTDEYTSYGSQDIFVACFDGEGAFQWSFRAGGISADYISGVTIDDAGFIIISGYFYGTATFGDTVIESTGSSDFFVAKLDPSGDLLWVTTAGGASSDQVRSVSSDAENRILVTGSFYDSITLDDTTLTTEDPVGVFIARYLDTGSLDMVFQLEGTYLSPEVYIAAADNGDFYVSGNFSETVYFGSKTFEAGEFNQDLYTVKYDNTGKLLWARHGHSFSSDQVVGVEVDIYNNLYVAGHYLDSIHFDQLTLPYTLCCGSREIFIVNYSSAGQVLWGEQVSGTRASLHGLSIDNSGKLLLSGWFTEDLFFGPFTLSSFEGFKNYLSGMETEMFTQLTDRENPYSFAVFPNPAEGRITISKLGLNDAELRLFDLSGRMVFNGRVYDGMNVDLGHLTPGYYLLRLDERIRNSTFVSKLILH